MNILPISSNLTIYSIVAGLGTLESMKHFRIHEMKISSTQHINAVSNSYTEVTFRTTTRKLIKHRLEWYNRVSERIKFKV